MLPKRIMQTWKNRTIPTEWLPSVRSIHRYMPDWEYTLMTDEDNRAFVAQHFPDLLPHYDAFEYPIQRADAIRYCWLYVHGGLYMDLDIEILRPLDPLFTGDVCLVPSGNLRACLTNAFMASQPRAPLWLDCIAEMKRPAPWWAVGKHLTVMATTGPMMLHRVAAQHQYVEIPSELIFPCSVCDTYCSPPPDAYARELPGSSWCGWDSHLYNFVFCNWGKIVVFGIILLAIIFKNGSMP